MTCVLGEAEDPEPQARVRRLHPDATIIQGNKSSYGYWSSKTTGETVDSLRPGAVEPLIVKPDGTVMQGNGRILVLEGRGYDTEPLARVPWP